LIPHIQQRNNLDAKHHKKRKKTKTFMDSKPTTYLIRNVKHVAKVVDFL